MTIDEPTEKERELAKAFREAMLAFRKAHGVSEATLLDMLLGTVAGAACRFGESREAFGARALVAYDTLAPLISGPTGIFGLLSEARPKQGVLPRPYLIDANGSIVEELWNGAEWVDSPQRPVGFACALVGGHELRITIPGLGTVRDADAVPLWKEMAVRLAEISHSFTRRANGMKRQQQRLE